MPRRHHRNDLGHSRVFPVPLADASIRTTGTGRTISFTATVGKKPQGVVARGFIPKGGTNERKGETDNGAKNLGEFVREKRFGVISLRFLCGVFIYLEQAQKEGK